MYRLSRVAPTPLCLAVSYGCRLRGRRMRCLGARRGHGPYSASSGLRAVAYTSSVNNAMATEPPCHTQPRFGEVTERAVGGRGWRAAGREVVVAGQGQQSVNQARPYRPGCTLQVPVPSGHCNTTAAAAACHVRASGAMACMLVLVDFALHFLQRTRHISHVVTLVSHAPGWTW